MKKYHVNFIEYHTVEVEAETVREAQEKAEEQIKEGTAGDTYLNMEWGDVECAQCGMIETQRYTACHCDDEEKEK